jgi:hypothetical protein
MVGRDLVLNLGDTVMPLDDNTNPHDGFSHEKTDAIVTVPLTPTDIVRPKRPGTTLANRLRACTSICGILLAGGAALLAGGIAHHEYWQNLLGGAPDEVMSLAVATIGLALAPFVMRYHQAAEVAEVETAAIRATLERQEAGLWELTTAGKKQNIEIERLIRENERLTLDRQKDADEKRNLGRKVEALTTKISSCGLVEDDSPQLWETVPATPMLTFQGMFNREVREVITPHGVEFQATKWAMLNLLPRITDGTALNDWRIVLHIPKVDQRTFDTVATLPARKLVYCLDHLVDLAERQGKEVNLRHIRISVVRSVAPEHQHRSIFAFTRQTEDGPENLVITYHRPPTSRIADYNDGKVIVHRGAVDQKHLYDIADRYFYAGIRMTIDEFREAVISGRYPDGDTAVFAGDHMSFPRRRD